MNLPVQLNGPQASLLNGVLIKGTDDLFVLDQKVNGSDLLVVVARGAARDYAKAQLFSGNAAQPEEPVPTDAPPIKVVPVRDGVRDNDPRAPKAR